SHMLDAARTRLTLDDAHNPELAVVMGDGSQIAAQVAAIPVDAFDHSYDKALEDDHAHHHAEASAILSLDYLGIFASTLCLIHCLAMPFIIAFLPFLGWQFLEGPAAHRVLASFVITFAIFAIVPGYLKHRRKDILMCMILGLGSVLFATFLAGPMFGEQSE